MNRFKTIILLLAGVILGVSCDKNEPVVEYLEVTPNNIAGEWKQTGWNGNPLDTGTYFYIDFVRKDKKFTMYQNFDSIADMPHIVTGTYAIEYIEEKGAVISGKYDYDEGFWAYAYVVEELTKTSMTWKYVVKYDDGTEKTGVKKFVRCNIPAIYK